MMAATESVRAAGAGEIRVLGDRHGYEPWRVRILDIQRRGIRLENPPIELLPSDLRARFYAATAVLQANGFSFTASETSSVGQIETPYLAVAGPCADGRSGLSLTCDGLPVNEFDSLHLVELMGKPSDHYFAFKDQAGRPLHTYLIVNPYENCAFRCRYCSRLPHFAAAGHDYRATLARMVGDVLSAVDSPDQVRFINIITGSQRDADGDLTMFREITEAFDRAGFGHCEYGVYTSNIHTRGQMEALRRMRVVFLTMTVENTTADARVRLHEPGNPKRTLAFPDVLQTLREAERIFPFVNTTMMLGYESSDDVKSGFTRLASETRATINHYIPRLWLRSQERLLHPGARNLEYYVDLFSFIERRVNAGRNTVGSFFEDRFGIPPFKVRYRS